MTTKISSTLAALQQYLRQHPSIKLITPSSPDFDSLRTYFIWRNVVPLAIVRPQNAEDVQALVRYCVANGVDFHIRTGGHDCAGRSQVDGALTIDMRDIKHIRIDPDGATATVGGGIIVRDLTKELDSRGLVTPVGTIASVGYVGWATLGGYGPFSPNFGLGVDQIVAAKLVNHKGELIEADDELLKGLRGGGGIFGVVVEMTIKVYPLKEILVSLLVFEWSTLKTAWTTYTEWYEKLAAEHALPKALQLQPFGIELPNQGRVLAVGAIWSSADYEEGLEWIGKVADLGHCVANNPEMQSVTRYVEFVETLMTYPSYGRAYTLSIKKLTPKSAELLAKHTALIPGGGMALSIHTVRAPVESNVSVFGARIDHHTIEILAMTRQKDLETKGAEWASQTAKDLKDSDPDNILEFSYVALVGVDDADYKKIYGLYYDTLLALKKKYDPDNVFKHAVPRLAI